MTARPRKTPMPIPSFVLVERGEAGFRGSLPVQGNMEVAEPLMGNLEVAEPLMGNMGVTEPVFNEMEVVKEEEKGEKASEEGGGFGKELVDSSLERKKCSVTVLAEGSVDGRASLLEEIVEMITNLVLGTLTEMFGTNTDVIPGRTVATSSRAVLATKPF